MPPHNIELSFLHATLSYPQVYRGRIRIGVITALSATLNRPRELNQTVKILFQALLKSIRRRRWLRKSFWLDARAVAFSVNLRKLSTQKKYLC